MIHYNKVGAYERRDIGEWFGELFEKILENPVRNIIILIVSGYIIYAMGEVIFESYGLITLLGYIFSCLYGISKIVDDPRRTVAWGVGYFIGAMAFKMIPEFIFPELKSVTWVSTISILVILYVIIQFYLKARKLKSY